MRLELREFNFAMKIKRAISEMLISRLVNNLLASVQYRDDDETDDSDDLSNDQWYETFSVEAEEKVYDDLCSVASSKVEEW